MLSFLPHRIGGVPNRPGKSSVIVRMASKWRVLVTVGLLACLPAFTNLKLAGLQPEDLLLLALLAFCVGKWCANGFRFRVSTALHSAARNYLLLLLALLCFAILAFRLPFFPLQDASVLKSPLLFSASRYLQFASIICGFLWLTNVLVEDHNRLIQALNVYWWTGVACCFYACVSFAALTWAHIDLYGAYDLGGALRARGVFNEGGPFGLYVVSVLILGILRRFLTGKKLGYMNTAVCCLAFLLSDSHAALLAVGLLFLCSILAASSFRKRVTYLILATVLVSIAAEVMNLPDVLASYFNNYQNIDEKVAVMGEVDTSLVMGRIAAAYIVPRMIIAHPITGIGIGNYSLMRNNPRYLGHLPEIRWVEDLPGLGLFGDVAELGIPATIFLTFLLLIPFRMCTRRSSILGSAALFQLFAHLLGAHLNFFYPWFVSACAIAAERHAGVPSKVRGPLSSWHRLIAVRHSALAIGDSSATYIDLRRLTVNPPDTGLAESPD